MEQADLHLHSCFSDGTLTPEEIVVRARKRNFSTIALTDHDTVDGLPRAIAAGVTYGVRVIPGVELSTYYGGAEIHIIGLGIDHRSAALNAMLADLRSYRVECVRKMVAKLRKFGVVIDPQEVFALAGGGVAGRAHLAEVIWKAGYTSSPAEAFERFLRDNGPAYEPKTDLWIEDAVEVITAACGIPVLAHPGANGRDELIPLFVQKGVRAIEAYYSSHTYLQSQYYVQLARKLGTLVSGGSDCHGQRKGRELFGTVRLPPEYLDPLLDGRTR